VESALEVAEVAGEEVHSRSEANVPSAPSTRREEACELTLEKSRETEKWLGEELCEGLPVVAGPAFGEVLAEALREADVVEDEFGTGGLVGKLKFDDGKDSGIPVGDAPGLHDASAGDQLKMTADDVAAE
jgi:hypothetical protein